MSEDNMEVGKSSRDLQDFDRGARTTEGFLNKETLNPQPLSWKQKLARAVGIGTVAGAAIGGTMAFANHQMDERTADIGEPLTSESHVIEVELQKIKNDEGKLVGPTFSDDLKGEHPLTAEQLLERGIDVSSGRVNVLSVKGATYATNQGFGEIEGNGPRHGAWGEIYVGEKPTGIYMKKYYFQEITPEETTLK